VRRLFAAELRRKWTLYRRYPVEVATGLVMVGLTFVLLLAGGYYLAGPQAQFGDRIESLVIGYAIWTLVLFALGDSAATFRTEAMTGTLEQMYLSPYGTLRITVARTMAGTLLHVGITGAVLVALLMLTRTSVRFPLVAIVPLVAAIGAAQGLGLALGGLALVFKRADGPMNMARFLMIVPVIVPLETEARTRWLSSVLPVAPAATMLRNVMARQQSIDAASLITALANGAVYLLLGALLLAWADAVVRRRGLIGQY
jgi:ABC-2 type transport system permease protein